MAFSKVKKSALSFGNQIGIGGYSTVYKATWRQAVTLEKATSGCEKTTHIPTQGGRNYVEARPSKYCKTPGCS